MFSNAMKDRKSGSPQHEYPKHIISPISHSTPAMSRTDMPLSKQIRSRVNSLRRRCVLAEPPLQWEESLDSESPSDPKIGILACAPPAVMDGRHPFLSTSPSPWPLRYRTLYPEIHSIEAAKSATSAVAHRPHYSMFYLVETTS